MTLHPNSRNAAITASVVLFGVAILQLLLALGFPLGHYAWGGAHEVLPKELRIASIAAICIYVLIAAVILSRANVVNIIRNKKATYYGTWAFVVFFGIGVLMNAISRSPVERWNVPVVLILAYMSFIVARSEDQ